MWESMVMYRLSLFLLLLCVTSQVMSDQEGALIDLLKRLKSKAESSRLGRQRTESSDFHFAESDESRTANINNQYKLIDSPNINPDSKLEELVETFIDIRDGEGYRAEGIHPELSRNNIATSLEKIILTPEQKGSLPPDDEEFVTNDGDIIPKTSKREFIKKSSSYWKDGIVPYRFNTDKPLKADSIDVVLKAIALWQDKTCIQWKPVTDDLSKRLGHTDYVDIKNGGGCVSYIGQIHSGAQPLSLQEPGCISVGVAAHEMGHAIGMFHEQSRSDRDEHVNMHWDVIFRGRNNTNMWKHDTVDSVPYDYGSDLHYGLYAFSSVKGKKSISFTEPELEFLAGSRKTLSFYDIMAANIAYKCANKCKNPPSCINGGFVNHRCECYCPAGLKGNTCQVIDGNCGSIIDIASGQTTEIVSPNYPENYNLGVECVWLVRAPTDKLVELHMEDFELSDNPENHRCYHWLEIQYNLVGQPGPKFCGDSFLDKPITTTIYGESNLLMIKFNSKSFLDKSASKGFRLSVTTVDVGCASNPCLNGGKCVPSTKTTDLVCICTSGYAGKYCGGISDAKVFCGFENKDYGCSALVNSTSDDFDWNVGSGSTPSPQTGPSAAKSGLSYAYIEASSPRVAGDKALLTTNTLFSPMSRCLSFAYNLNGANVGQLGVYVEGKNKPNQRVWMAEGNHGDMWLSVDITIPSMEQLRITFEGIRGSGWKADIAIDDVSIATGACSLTSSKTKMTSTPTTPKPQTKTMAPTQPTTTSKVNNICLNDPCLNGAKCIESTITPDLICICTSGYTGRYCGEITDAKVFCGFEKNDHGCSAFVNSSSDDFDWSVGSGTTPSPQTGPSAAKSGLSYAYIETSSPRVDGDKALLVSNVSFSPMSRCLSFAYSLHGEHIASLRVYIEGMNQLSREIWKATGDHGDKWRNADVTMSSMEDLKITFEGTRGNGYRGDIAIDDITIATGACSGSPSTKRATTTTTTVKTTTTRSSPITTTHKTTTNVKMITSLFTTPMTQPSHGIFHCDFDENDCGVINWFTDFQWTFGTVGGGHSGDGRYYTIPITSSQSDLNVGVFELPYVIENGKDYCLSFYLRLPKSNNQPCPRFEIVTNAILGRTKTMSHVWDLGKQCDVDQWREYSVNVGLSSGLARIGFVGSYGKDKTRDLQVDDICLIRGKC